MTTTLQTGPERAVLVDPILEPRGQADAPATPPRKMPRARPHGIDLLVVRLSVAALLWAGRRADRAQLPREEHQRRFLMEQELERREHHVRRMVPGF